MSTNKLLRRYTVLLHTRGSFCLRQLSSHASIQPREHINVVKQRKSDEPNTNRRDGNLALELRTETDDDDVRRMSRRRIRVSIQQRMNKDVVVRRPVRRKEVVEVQTDRDDVVRFSFGEETQNGKKKIKVSKKVKVNQLRFFRLKAKRKIKSPNPEVRIRYKIGKAKRKEEWLIEKLRKYDMSTKPGETYDPEILTEEERFYIKRIGEKKKHYVPVGRRGVFGGVVLNMHLHWKRHETVKVSCKPCRPGQIHEYAAELARLSHGIVMDIKPDNTILFYRGKNYVQPEVMSPPDTLSKAKAMEKYKFGQSLEHTSQFIEKLEKELEEYQKHLERYKSKKRKEVCNSDVDG